ncbi:zinc finger protein 616-like [Anoplophora glabripennis]|uniref:zinc finger protein 616-like n=1 Tax=Anoplophora glabripennis TaxID=217634 RepID=UPI000873D593|nr:zinc finger protein 616-like [Anoplophora glabripennis]
MTYMISSLVCCRRLCLNTIGDTSWQVIGKAAREALQIILPNLKLEEGSDKHVMCKECFVKLFTAFNFKTACMGTEDIMFPYVNASSVSVVDLKEVYLKEKGNTKLNGISKNQRICRLCIQLVTNGFVSLNEVDDDIIETYIPQVNIGATKDPVICGPCFDSLRTHSGFLKNCLAAQEKYESTNMPSYIKSEELEVKLEDDQDVQEKYDFVDMPDYIKSEEIEIKMEENDQDNDSSSYNLDNRIIENKTSCTSEDLRKMKIGYICKCETGEVQAEKCKAPLDVSSHKGEHKVSDICTQGTKCKSLNGYQLMHEDSSVFQTYECNICNYETKHEGFLRKHQLLHKVPTKIQMYKCDTCGYKTKHKHYVKRHQLVHKDPLEIEMYKCDECTYEGKHKSDLKAHQLLHKDPREIQMYKCDVCDYETKRKTYLRIHQLMHKDPLEIRMHKCDMCSYEAKHKNSLKLHQLTHKNTSEVQMYKCDTCIYETKF